MAEIIAIPNDEYPLFPVGLGELHTLGKDTAAALLRQRLDALTLQRDQLAGRLLVPLGKGVSERVLFAPLRHLHMLGAEIDWIEAIVTRIESGDLDWGDDHVAATHHAAPPRDLTKESP